MTSGLRVSRWCANSGPRKRRRVGPTQCSFHRLPSGIVEPSQWVMLWALVVERSNEGSW
jgi:hypothetical protein